MKKLRANWFVLATTISFLVITVGVIFYTAAQHTPRARNQQAVATPSFIPTSGPPPQQVQAPTLERPLNRNQALQKVLDYDKSGAARWDTAWSLDTLTTEPERIQAELVSLRALEPRIGRFPDMADEELVWKITIHGPVWLYGIGWSCKCSGVTYLIWPKTGEVFGILSEEPVLEKGFGRGGRP